ncbi:MAG: hypothetical protein HFE76_03960 [Firmicutes bacterium]|nr:hypothetical protein [Bacillota bacterium]
MRSFYSAVWCFLGPLLLSSASQEFEKVLFEKEEDLLYTLDKEITSRQIGNVLCRKIGMNGRESDKSQTAGIYNSTGEEAQGNGRKS